MRWIIRQQTNPDWVLYDQDKRKAWLGGTGDKKILFSLVCFAFEKHLLTGALKCQVQDGEAKLDIEIHT